MIRGLALALILALPAAAEDLSFFRIGNGETSGSYYPIGGLIASAISNPPGSVACAAGGPCGVPGLLASAIASPGSVENLRAIAEGRMESGFAQADLVRAAWQGSAPFEDAPVEDLRLIANLYPEYLHIVTRADSGIARLADLDGRKVALGHHGSGTRRNATRLLDMAGVEISDADLSDTDSAAQALAAGQIDALFFMGGAPAPVITALAGRSDIALIPVDAELAGRLAKADDLLSPASLGARMYPGLDSGVETISVPAQWVTRADLPEDVIYSITRVLWNDNTMRILAFGHASGRQVRRDYATVSTEIPFHPGAARYYREAGLIDEP